MNEARILIVDDEPGIRLVLENSLAREGYQISAASDGIEALKKLEETIFDVVLLDLAMKPLGGIQVLNMIRERGIDSSVIILTAHSTVDSAVDALRLGAFDYLYKPATPDAIRQRVREALHQRQQNLYRSHLLNQLEGLRQSLTGLDAPVASPSQPAPSNRFLKLGSLVVDRHDRSATLNNQPLDLTTTEFRLLVCLAEAAPVPVPAPQLVLYALGYEADEAEARELIKFHIFQLRQKVEPDSSHPRYLKTERYKGYFWSMG
jgi:two-component system alkaline phosphatase synthesis response regulator PhoP